MLGESHFPSLVVLVGGRLPSHPLLHSNVFLVVTGHEEKIRACVFVGVYAANFTVYTRVGTDTIARVLAPKKTPPLYTFHPSSPKYHLSSQASRKVDLKVIHTTYRVP